MSHQCIADAFAPATSDYKNKVIEHTFGHLAPKRNKTYSGTMVFACGAYGDLVIIDSNFDIDDSPWFFDDMMSLVCKEAKDYGKIYKFTGSYCNHIFTGETKEVKVV